MQPLTQGASPQKSTGKMGLVLRMRWMPRRNSLRSAGVSMRLHAGSRPTGMYRKCQPSSAPLAMSGSTNSSLARVRQLLRVTVTE